MRSKNILNIAFQFHAQLEVLTKAEEYSELRFQQGEKQILNALNKNPNIRFPLKGRATTVVDKVFLLIQVCLIAELASAWHSKHVDIVFFSPVPLGLFSNPTLY